MNKTRLNKPDNKSGLNFGGIKYCGPFHLQNFWEDLVSLIDHFKNFDSFTNCKFFDGTLFHLNLGNLNPTKFDLIKVIKGSR